MAVQTTIGANTVGTMMSKDSKGLGGNYHYMLKSLTTSTSMDVNVDVWPGPSMGKSVWNRHTTTDTFLIVGGTLFFMACVGVFLWMVKRSSMGPASSGGKPKAIAKGSTGADKLAISSHAATA